MDAIVQIEMTDGRNNNKEMVRNLHHKLFEICYNSKEIMCNLYKKTMNDYEEVLP